MPTVDYLPVATATGANVDSQAAFAGSGYQTLGFQTGIAIPSSANKIWRQATMVSAAIANFIANQLGINVLDDGNLSALITNFTNAITHGAGATFQTNGVNNTLQSLLNLTAGANITLTNPSGGQVIIAASGFTPPQFETNGSLNSTQALLNLANGTNVTMTESGGTVTINAATAPHVVAAFYLKNLPSNVGFSSYSLTSIDTQAITFPSTGGPWRVIADYSYYVNGGVGFQSGIYDGSNWFAVAFGQIQNNNYLAQGCAVSPVTYANSATVTFHSYCFSDGSGTVVPTQSGLGQPSRMYAMGQSNMKLTVISS